MREIKFRAWDKENNEMVYQNKLIYNGKYKFYVDKYGMVLTKVKVFNIYEDVQADIMQYTGLKDKNGKEMYEGDIVERTFLNLIERDKFIGTIKYYEGTYNIDNDKEACSVFHEIDTFEVIGNIYENKELLEDN